MSDIDKLQKAGVKAFQSGEYEEALEKFEAVKSAAEAAGDTDKAAEALNDIGVIRKQLDDIPGAFEALNTALTYYQDKDDELGEAKVLGNLGMVEEAAGQYDDAVQSYIDAASIFEEYDESDMAMYCWQALSRLKMNQKEWIGAISAYEEGIAHLPDSSMKKKFLQTLLKFPNKFLG